MRLAGQAKMGYYPLPPTLIPTILSHLSAPHGGIALDPCLGEGAAMAEFARSLGLDAYGIELDQKRAQAAAERFQALEARVLKAERKTLLPRVLNDSLYNVLMRRGQFNFLYLNPPYDHGEGMREELAFLKLARQTLQPGGVLCYVVPQKILAIREVADYLSTYFRQLTIGRFPDGEYEAFGQVVVLGIHNGKGVKPDPDQVGELRRMGELGALLDPLLPGSGTYVLPKMASGHFRFESAHVDPNLLLEIGRSHGATNTPEWHTAIRPTQILMRSVRPVMPLKIGHLLALMASGVFNGQVLHDPESGEKLIIRGHTFKEWRKKEEELELEDGGKRITDKHTQILKTQINTISSSGENRAYVGEALEQFLTRFMPQLSRFVAEMYPPLYAFDEYDGSSWAKIIDKLSLRRILKLTGTAGFLPAQKHATAAMCKLLSQQDSGILVGEMGTGKTTMGIGIAAGIRAKRTLVVCPPHLVNKWAREAEQVWPGVSASVLETISDVDAWFSANPTRPQIGVMAITRIRAASGWRAAYTPPPLSTPKYRKILEARYGPERFADLMTRYAEKMNRIGGMTRHWESAKCPHCGGQVYSTKSEFPLMPEQMDRLKAPPRCVGRLENGFNSQGKRDFVSCNAPLYRFKRNERSAPASGSFQGLFAREQQIRQAIRSKTDPDQIWSWDARAYAPLPPSEAAAFLNQVTIPDASARWPLATYIREAYGGQVDLLLIDEAHQIKGDSSDQGLAAHDLICASVKTVGLTGTIYGGKASNLFHLLYRIDGEVRKAFTNDELSGRKRLMATRWVDDYGILQKIETREEDRYGKQSANRKSRVTIKELPSASPHMLLWLLSSTVFVSLPDMGFALPEYEEIPIAVTPSVEMQGQYESLKRQIKEVMDKQLALGNKKLLGAYLASMLMWPDSPFRPEVVRDPTIKKLQKEAEAGDPDAKAKWAQIAPLVKAGADVIAQIPGIGGEEIFPKEQEIIDLVLKEKRAGRRCLLYCQQTNIRDIQPRWVTLLKAQGLKVGVLKAEPKKREAWVAKQVKEGVDVIITHPKKVETGIDLLDFPTIIWMGIEYSAYTLLQASRRSWRIGQTEKVKVYFFVYEHTLQHDALRLIASKAAAVSRVNGDTVQAELAQLDENGDTDMMGALAKIALSGEKLEIKGLGEVFQEANQAFHDGIAYVGEADTGEEAMLAKSKVPKIDIKKPSPLPRRLEQPVQLSLSW